MIDFRYHLVSLISVFLALAVGIILGAGPLQGTLGETLTRQVDTLREERNDLRDQLEDVTGRVNADEAWLTAAAPRLLEGSLTGREVAVVALGDVRGSTITRVADQLDTAGANVVVEAELPPVWTDPEEESTQVTLAEGLRETLTDAGLEVPEDNPVTTLGAAVTLALTGMNADAERSGVALDLEQQLQRFGLLRLDAQQDVAADAVVLLTDTPPAEPVADATPTADTSPTLEPVKPSVAADVWTDVTAGVDLVAQASLLAGPTSDGDDVVQRVRSDDGLVDEVSTVSDPESLVGRITIPLALAAVATGHVDHYGPEEDATTIPPVPEPASDDSDN